MARKRWLVAWKDSVVKPVFYHCISRVVDRKRVFGQEEKEKFRTFMRMQENFSGCRVVSYCLMSNHIHLLLEVPPMPEGGLSDEGLLARLRAIYHEAEVAVVASELEEARKMEASGAPKMAGGAAVEALVGAVVGALVGTGGSVGMGTSITTGGTVATGRVMEIHGRYTYRMHDLSEFMKTLMQRFTKWFNRTHGRTGNLWEDAFKSVIVEDGYAAKTIAAYIDLNPVRAGIVKDPADYRWSSYGEAIGGGAKGNGKKARAGLVRALRAHKGCGADASLWANAVSREYRKLLLAGAVEKLEQSGKLGNAEKFEARVQVGAQGKMKRIRKGMSAEEVAEEVAEAKARQEREGELSVGKMLRCRVRYFTDGAVIGSRSFVNEAFVAARERFGSQRKDGARKLRGSGAAAAGALWSVRDLKKDV
jgi:REP element-mobilizing transposase RayT